MSGANINLKDIIENKIVYARKERDNAIPEKFMSDAPYDITYEEYVHRANFEIRALEEMLADVENMSEQKFREKYRAIVKAMHERFDREAEVRDKIIAETKANGGDVDKALAKLRYSVGMEWYNNAIFDILMLYDMDLLFDV